MSKYQNLKKPQKQIENDVRKNDNNSSQIGKHYSDRLDLRKTGLSVFSGSLCI